MRLMCCRRFCRGEIALGQPSTAIGSELFHVACGASELKERIAAEKLRQLEEASKPKRPRKPEKANPNWPYQDRHFQPA